MVHCNVVIIKNLQCIKLVIGSVSHAIGNSSRLIFAMPNTTTCNYIAGTKIGTHRTLPLTNTDN